MSPHRLDDVDRRILEFLCRDARVSNREIAQSLGIVEGTVRLRIKRMQQENIMRIVPVTTRLGESRPTLAYLGIHAELSQAREAANAVAELPFVRFVATMLGRYDILAMTTVASGAELLEQVNSHIITIPGVRHVDTSLAVKLIKYDYRWGRIVPEQQVHK